MCFFVLFGASRRPAFLRFRTNDVLLGTLGAGVRICGVSNSPARMEQLPGWNNYLGSILRLGWNNYLDGTTTWVRTCVLRPLGHSLYQLSYVEHLRSVRDEPGRSGYYIARSLRQTASQGPRIGPIDRAVSPQILRTFGSGTPEWTR